LAGENINEFTDANFKAEVLDSTIPVLIDFWAPWCGPCRMVAPVVEQLAAEYAGKAKVGKVNVDDNPTIATNYGIRSIPTLIVIKAGKVIGQVIGAVGKGELMKLLDKAF
jgi:thioredoxin 1